MLYALLVTSRKLRHYFQGHPIHVVTSFSLETILWNREATGRVAKWTVELSGFDLTFLSTHIIKSRALVEFVAEWTPTPDIEREDLTTGLHNDDSAVEHWTLYFDGSLTLNGAGASVVIYAPTGEELRYAI